MSKPNYLSRAEWRRKRIKTLRSQILYYGGKTNLKLPQISKVGITKERFERIDTLYRSALRQLEIAKELETTQHRVLRIHEEERRKNLTASERGRLGNIALREKLARLTEAERTEFYHKRSKKSAETRKKQTPKVIRREPEPNETGEYPVLSNILKENIDELLELFNSLMSEIDSVANEYLTSAQAEFHTRNAQDLKEMLNEKASKYGDRFYVALNNTYNNLRGDIDVVLYSSEQDQVDFSLTRITLLLEQTARNML